MISTYPKFRPKSLKLVLKLIRSNSWFCSLCHRWLRWFFKRTIHQPWKDLRQFSFVYLYILKNTTLNQSRVRYVQTSLTWAVSLKVLLSETVALRRAFKYDSQVSIFMPCHVFWNHVYISEAKIESFIFVTTHKTLYRSKNYSPLHWSRSRRVCSTNILVFFGTNNLISWWNEFPSIPRLSPWPNCAVRFNNFMDRPPPTKIHKRYKWWIFLIYNK